jgi:hypothetical protein
MRSSFNLIYDISSGGESRTKIRGADIQENVQHHPQPAMDARRNSGILADYFLGTCKNVEKTQQMGRRRRSVQPPNLWRTTFPLQTFELLKQRQHFC